MRNVVVSNLSTSSPGGSLLYASAASTVKLVSVNVTSATALGGSGGAVYSVDSSSVVLLRSSFTNCSAPGGSGGAVAITSTLACVSSFCSTLQSTATLLSTYVFYYVALETTGALRRRVC